MAFIDAMIKKHLRKTVPQLTNRPAPGGGGGLRASCMTRIISTNTVTSAICWSGRKMEAFKLSTSYVISSIYGLCGIA